MSGVPPSAFLTQRSPDPQLIHKLVRLPAAEWSIAIVGSSALPKVDRARPSLSGIKAREPLLAGR